MTLHDALSQAYVWGVAHGTWILSAAVAIPLFGALAAALGKRGKTDEDGRAIASIVLGLGALAVFGEMVAIHFAHTWFHARLLDADLRLAVAPVVFLAGCLVAIRRVFPLNELAATRSIVYLVVVFLGCWGLFWFFSQFHGWYMVAWGGILQLILVLVVACFLLWRLFRRALNPTRHAPARGERGG